jgi:outer membrane cobalamin receptor
MTIQSLRNALAWLMALGTLPAPAALAASVEGLIELPFEELMAMRISSANKISQALKDIPAHVTVFTRQDLADYGYSRLTDVLRNMPGLYLEEDTEEIYLGTRGSIGGGILLLVNGVPQHPSLQKGLTTVEANRLNIPVSAIDRIEFVRGPMSVIYGNNAFQGSLNIITNAPGSGHARLAVASDQGGELFARMSQAFEGGSFTLNLGASQQGGPEGDYRDMMSAEQFAELGPDNPSSMNGNFQRELRSLDASFDWQGWSGGLRYQASAYPIFPTEAPIRDNDLALSTWLASLQYQAPLADKWHSRSQVIVSDDRYDLSDMSFLTPSLEGEQEQRSTRIEFEQNFVYRPTDDQALLLGYRFQQIRNVENDAFVGIGETPILDDTMRTGDTHLHDLFAQWQQALPNDFGLVAGVRYSRLPSHYSMTRAHDVTGAPTMITDTPVEDRNQFNYRLALLYSMDEQNQFKLLHGTASQDSASILLTEPKEMVTTELVHVFDNARWLVRQSLYTSTIRSVMRRSLSFDGEHFVSLTVNDGEWRTVGYDIDTTYRITPAWRLSAALSLQKTDDRKNAVEVGYSPQTLFQLKTDYRTHADTFAFYAHFVSDRYSDWRYVDTDSDGEPDTPERLGKTADGYWNLNLNWRHQFSKTLSANLNVSNLLDADYRYPANEVSNLARGLIAEGRVISASLQVNF